MHHLSNLLRPWVATAACVVACGVAIADAPLPAVSVQYELHTVFTGTEQAGGRIVVTLSNHSDQALSDLRLRLADASLGQVTGPLQDDLDLVAGESRRLEGDFILDAEAVRTSRPLEWVVVFTDAQGFARQEFVRGDGRAAPVAAAAGPPPSR